MCLPKMRAPMLHNEATNVVSTLFDDGTDVGEVELPVGCSFTVVSESRHRKPAFFINIC